MRIPDAVRSLERDLRDIFGNRMQSLVVYAPADRSADQPTLAVVDALTADDLRACASLVGRWRDASLATPLFLESQEFARSLDAFPFEFGAILANHTVVAGVDPFDGLRVDAADVRRACEVQVRSHLLHLREGYIETEGRSDRLVDLIARSSGPLAALTRNVRCLDPGYSVPPVFERVMASGVTPLTSDEARRGFPEYLAAVGQLAAYVEHWGST
jgi:hypothetical protein